MVVPLLRYQQGDDWGRESSLLLLRMNIVWVLGWESRRSYSLRTKRFNGILKKLGNVCLALREMINMRDSPKD